MSLAVFNTEENLGNVEWQELINICYHDDIRRSEQLKIFFGLNHWFSDSNLHISSIP